MKKYNKQTKGYKIDIYADGYYVGSSDGSKTCKAARDRFIEKHPEFCKDKKITALFDKN